MRRTICKLMMSVVLCAGLLGVFAVPAAAQQAPAQAGPAAKQDSATMEFFRKTEVSGFVDMYYTYNFNTPARPCMTVAGVAAFNCLSNFNFAHNSFTVSLAEIALEKKPTSDSRGVFWLPLFHCARTS